MTDQKPSMPMVNSSRPWETYEGRPSNLSGWADAPATADVVTTSLDQGLPQIGPRPKADQ
jgi:hypothetical protein